MALIRVVDAFAGIGGFRLAAEQAAKSLGIKFECVKSVENNKDACKTYELNFGENPFGDMKKIPFEEYPEHDLLLGGFPCQAFSRNGRVYNFTNRNDGKTLAEDDRSPLFLRLYGVLKTAKPKFFVFENVKEITTIRNEDGSLFFEDFLKCMREDYDVNYTILDSKSFGLPQQRRRTYIVGQRKDLHADDFVFPDTSSEVFPAVKNILEQNVPTKYFLENLWKERVVPGNSKKKRTLLDVVKKLKKLGREHNGYANLIEQKIKEGKHSLSRLEALRLARSSNKWKDPQERTGRIEPISIIYGDTPSGLPRQQDKLYSINGISPTIATFSTPAFDVDGTWRMLTPRECARLQGFPDAFKLPNSDSKAYKQIGNAVSVCVAESVIKCLLQKALNEKNIW